MLSSQTGNLLGVLLSFKISRNLRGEELTPSKRHDNLKFPTKSSNCNYMSLATCKLGIGINKSCTELVCPQK